MAEEESDLKSGIAGVQFMAAPKETVEQVDKGYTGEAVDERDMGLPMNIVTERTGLSEEQVRGEAPVDGLQDEEEEQAEAPVKKNKETSKARYFNKSKRGNDIQWTKEPSVEGQIEMGEDYVKPGPQQCELFDLSKEDDKKKYNELLKREFPESAPQVMIEYTDRQTYEGKFLVLVHYREILYKKS